MRDCVYCGGRLRRIHRTFREKLTYVALYECRDCHDVTTIPHGYRYHLGVHCRCPRCGTLRITRLKERDKIDPMETGFLHLLERLAGGKLYHCHFCRVQFHDRRVMATDNGRERRAVPQENAAHLH
jgi:hypothetical protein